MTNDRAWYFLSCNNIFLKKLNKWKTRQKIKFLIVDYGAKNQNKLMKIKSKNAWFFNLRFSIKFALTNLLSNGANNGIVKKSWTELCCNNIVKNNTVNSYVNNGFQHNRLQIKRHQKLIGEIVRFTNTVVFV